MLPRNQMESPAPRQFVTRELIQRLDAALETTGGNRNHAAQLLQMDNSRVNYIIGSDPHLRYKWGKKEMTPPEPSPAADVHREPGVEVFNAALEKQDALLQQGWKRLGFNSNERKFLEQLQLSYAGNIKGTLDLAYGGLAHANTRLLLALEEVCEKIADIIKNPQNYERSYTTQFGERVSKTADEYRLEYETLRVKIADQLRKMGDSATKANLLRLKAEQLKLEKEGVVKKKEAGWLPTTSDKTVDAEVT